jgi:hypothetical protein
MGTTVTRQTINQWRPRRCLLILRQNTGIRVYCVTGVDEATLRDALENGGQVLHIEEALPIINAYLSRPKATTSPPDRGLGQSLIDWAQATSHPRGARRE